MAGTPGKKRLGVRSLVGASTGAAVGAAVVAAVVSRAAMAGGGGFHRDTVFLVILIAMVTLAVVVLGAGFGAVGAMAEKFVDGIFIVLWLIAVPVFLAALTGTIELLHLSWVMSSFGGLCAACGAVAARAVADRSQTTGRIQFSIRELLFVTFLVASLAASLASIGWL